jgi:hypothetical protein
MLIEEILKKELDMIREKKKKFLQEENYKEAEKWMIREQIILHELEKLHDSKSSK